MLGKSTTFLFFLLVLSNNAIAEGAPEQSADFRVQKLTVHDGVYFATSRADAGMLVKFSGSDGVVISRNFAAGQAGFIDINNAGGQPLVDGLYRYEIKPLPKVSISREVSAKMADRNTFKPSPANESSPVSGSFRVVGGQVVDDQLEEFSLVNSGEIEK